MHTSSDPDERGPDLRIKGVKVMKTRVTSALGGVRVNESKRDHKLIYSLEIYWSNNVSQSSTAIRQFIIMYS